MEGIISEEEGLASGICLTAEEGDTLVEALQLLRRHAEAIRNSGRPFAVEASEAIAKRLIPVSELVLMMFEDGIIRPPKEPEDVGEILDLLHPDPWGQAAQRSEYMMADEAYDVRGFADDGDSYSED